MVRRLTRVTMAPMAAAGLQTCSRRWICAACRTSATNHVGTCETPATNHVGIREVTNTETLGATRGATRGATCAVTPRMIHVVPRGVAHGEAIQETSHEMIREMIREVPHGVAHVEVTREMIRGAALIYLVTREVASVVRSSRPGVAAMLGLVRVDWTRPSLPGAGLPTPLRQRQTTTLPERIRCCQPALLGRPILPSGMTRRNMMETRMQPSTPAPSVRRRPERLCVRRLQTGEACR